MRKRNILLIFVAFILLASMVSAGFQTLWNPWTNRLDFIRDSNQTSEKQNFGEVDIRDNLTVHGYLIVKQDFSNRSLDNITFLKNVTTGVLHELNVTDIVPGTLKVYATNGSNEFLLNSNNYTVDFIHGRFTLDSTRWQVGYNITLDPDVYYMPVNLTPGDAYVDKNLTVGDNVNTDNVTAVQGWFDTLGDSFRSVLDGFFDRVSSTNVTATDSLWATLFKLNTSAQDPPYVRGTMYWDNDSDSLSVQMAPNVTLQTGEEMYIRAKNQQGQQINNGQVVYVSGAQGNNPTILLATSNVSASSRVIGVATHDIPANELGFVTTYGIVHDIDTSAFLANDSVYLSPNVSGGLVNAHPGYPNYHIKIGTVLRSHATQGEILVRLGVDPTEHIVFDEIDVIKNSRFHQNISAEFGNFSSIGDSGTRLPKLWVNEVDATNVSSVNLSSSDQAYLNNVNISGAVVSWSINDTMDQKLQTIFYNASAISVVEGTSQGTIDKITAYNSGPFNVTETGGASPGYDFRVNFTGVTAFNQLVVRYKTEGGENQNTFIQIYDFVNDVWEDYSVESGSTSYITITLAVFDDASHISSGLVSVRFYQSDIGNPNHKHLFDWVTLSDGPGTPNIAETDPFAVYLDGTKNMTGGLNAPNVTASDTGWFSFLGTAISRIFKLWVNEVDATNVSAVNVTASDTVSGNVGSFTGNITTTQDMIASKFYGDGSSLTGVATDVNLSKISTPLLNKSMDFNGLNATNVNTVVGANNLTLEVLAGYFINMRNVTLDCIHWSNGATEGILGC